MKLWMGMIIIRTTVEIPSLDLYCCAQYPMSMINDSHKSTSTQLENTLHEYFVKKAPALPENIKEIIVKIAPYLTIISLIVTIPALFILLGLGGVVTTMAPLGGMRGVQSTTAVWLSLLFLIPVVILEAMAIPGLFSRSQKAWKFLYWAQIISVISSLVQLQLFNAILSAIIGFYILFQIKSHYK